jgi:hypothetical protein
MVRGDEFMRIKRGKMDEVNKQEGSLNQESFYSKHEKKLTNLLSCEK